MATSNQPAWFTNLPSSPSKSPEQVKKGQDITKGGIDIQTEQAKAPYAGPQAESSLTSSQQDLVSKAADVSGKEADRFSKAKSVETYVIALPQYAAALRTPKNKEGDSELVMLSAKIQDPSGSVREGDEQRFQNLQSALEQLPKKFQEEFTGSGGVFTEETRTNIRRILSNRVRSYNIAYKAERDRAISRVSATNNRLKAAGLPETFFIDPIKEVVGPHFGEAYVPDVEAYKKTLKPAVDEDRQSSVGLFDKLPPGAQISGEDVKGYRFTPEQTAQADAYKASEAFTPEGWADMITGFASENGIVTPETAKGFRDNALSVGTDIAKVKAEGGMPGPGFDYRDVDTAASKNAGLFEGVAQQFRNLPESAAQVAMGFAGIPRDALLSILTGERVGLYKSMPDLAIELVKQAGGAPTGETTAAVAQMLEERYGGLENIKRSAIKDPVGIASDISMLLSAGGTLATRASGLLSDVGETAVKAGLNTNPISLTERLVTEGVPAAYSAAKNKAPGAMEGVENIPSNLVGFPSGAGGASVREATGSGFAQGVAGKPTPRSKAFTENMRNAAGATEANVDAARKAVDRLKAENYQQYLDNTASLGINPQPLDFTKVQKRIEDIKPANYDDYLKLTDRPTEHLAWERMKRTTDEYAAQAAQNPALLLPVNVDNFKQNLFDIGSKATGAYDSKATDIANKAYGAVRGLIADFDPLYDAAMKTSREGIEAVKELENAFSLAPGRDRRVNVDAATRKLQSIWRNNASTNYGQRVNLGETLAKYDPEGIVKAGGAGQMLSSATPRGMSGTIAAGSMFGGAAINPAALLALPALVPRVVGEAAFGTGRLAGTGARYGKDVLDAVRPITTKFSELNKKYPTAVPTIPLALAQLGARGYDVERLMNEYGIGSPTMPVDAEPSEEIVVTATEGYPARNTAGLATAEEAAAAEAAAAEAAPVLKEGKLIDKRTGREIYLDPESNEYKDALTGEVVPGYQGMYRGGTVQAFRNGGQPKKQTSWYDDLTMAVSRRGNDLVALTADLADKYGLTPANATAWIAQNVAGYSPQQAAQIRKNLGGVSNRAIVNAGAASNEARFRNSGGVGARSADTVTPPVRMSDVAYRVQDIPRAVVSETPKALRAAGNYITSTSPQTMLRDAQRAGSVALNAIKEDPYGMAVDTALYPAFPLAASAGDFAAMRGGARELSPYVRDDAEAANAKRMVDALSVLPIGGGMAGRRLARRR